MPAMKPSYAGIGSRETPPDIQSLMTTIAFGLAERDFILRSGGARGADSAFEVGAGLSKEIFLPWKGYENNPSTLFNVPKEAIALAKTLHPAWDALTDGMRKMHARNCCQILGGTLDRPVSFVVCWTPDGLSNEKDRTRKSGGTATAIVLANRRNIPVYNLQQVVLRNSLAKKLANMNLTIDGLHVDEKPVLHQASLF